MSYPIGFISLPGGAEWIVIAAIGLLLFGKRLPEVGRSLGKGIIEFKKGLKGVEEDVNAAGDKHETPAQQPLLTAQTTQPATTATQPQFKFDPYTGKPVENSSTTPQT